MQLIKSHRSLTFPLGCAETLESVPEIVAGAPVVAGIPLAEIHRAIRRIAYEA